MAAARTTRNTQHTQHTQHPQHPQHTHTTQHTHYNAHTHTQVLDMRDPRQLAEGLNPRAMRAVRDTIRGARVAYRCPTGTVRTKLVREVGTRPAHQVPCAVLVSGVFWGDGRGAEQAGAGTRQRAAQRRSQGCCSCRATRGALPQACLRVVRCSVEAGGSPARWWCTPEPPPLGQAPCSTCAPPDCCLHRAAHLLCRRCWAARPNHHPTTPTRPCSSWMTGARSAWRSTSA